MSCIHDLSILVEKVTFEIYFQDNLILPKRKVKITVAFQKLKTVGLNHLFKKD